MAADAAATGTRCTPPLPLGPYYPLEPGAGTTNALWRGAAVPPNARALRLQGRVQSLGGRAVSGALVEIWHADPAGHYRHPSAPQRDKVLADFAGYGRAISDAAGRFDFTSLMPGCYGSGPMWRAPHLHVQISARFDRLVTQLFLPGHAENARDRWLRVVRDPRVLTAELVYDDALACHLRWTAVLARG